MKGMSWKVNIQFIVSSEMQLGSRLSYQIISTVFLNHEKTVYTYITILQVRNHQFSLKKEEAIVGHKSNR